MKWLSIVLICMTCTAQAQVTPFRTDSFSRQESEYLLKTGKQLKNIGIIMTLAGTGMMTVGFSIAMKNLFSSDRTGEGLFYSGLGVATIGVTLLLVGKNKIKKAYRMTSSANYGMQYAPDRYIRQSGLTLLVDITR
jgi:hypothetical protein